jgi:hypothetical protein
MKKIIDVDLHRGKLVTFNIEVEGLNYNDISGKFRVMIDDIEFGFPTTFKKDHEIEVVIPSLYEFIDINKRKIKTLTAKLEIFTDCHYFIPWEGKLKLTEKASVKVKLNKSTTTKPKVKTEMKDQEVKEEMEIIVDDPEEEVELPDPKETKKTSKTESVKSSLSSKSVLLDESSKSDYLDMLKNIDEKGIRSYMKRSGTTNERVQNVILEQADNICKNSDDKFELLKSVIKVMKKIKEGDKDGV